MLYELVGGRLKIHFKWKLEISEKLCKSIPKDGQTKERERTFAFNACIVWLINDNEAINLLDEMISLPLFHLKTIIVPHRFSEMKIFRSTREIIPEMNIELLNIIRSSGIVVETFMFYSNCMFSSIVDGMLCAATNGLT